ncbi:LacI family DNA-binding transcriptional regulator [Deinococcus sonorensis]|uniref:LacI family DNA-binding transcriptional regulator n=2 Tax=Deinococcus sonorensis TaxID=309891 RepID=A0AAU7UG33_9DEIO
MAHTVTLEDVARRAGVSPSTASRVLSGSIRVTARKTEAVMQAVQELGYSPNQIAQGLARGRSMNIGVVTQDISSVFYAEMLRGIEQGLADSEYRPLFISGHWQVAEERAALDALLGRPVDALIVLGGHTPDAVLQLLATRVPLVLVGRAQPPADGSGRPSAYSLRVDNALGARLGVQHLLELGHRRIAFISGPPDHVDAQERLRGYREALAHAGLPLDPQLVLHGDFQEASGEAAVEQLLTRGSPFTAVFAANDQMAFGARLALYRHGLRVPQDVSLLGFDNLTVSAYQTPPLTTVEQPTRQMGHDAAQLVLSVLAGQPQTQPSYQPRLVQRDSTAAPPASTRP